MHLCFFIGYLIGEKTTVTVAFNSFDNTRRIIKDWTGLGSTKLLKKSSFGICVKENHFVFNGQTDAKLRWLSSSIPYAHFLNGFTRTVPSFFSSGRS